MSSRTPTPVRNVHNCHRLQQQLQQCHQSLRVILMPSNSSDFNQILNLASLGHMQTTKNVIKDTTTTPTPVRNVHNHHRHQQQLQQCHQSLRVILMPSNSTDFNQILSSASSGYMQIIQNAIDRCQPNFKLSFLRAYVDHPKCHQGLQQQ